MFKLTFSIMVRKYWIDACIPVQVGVQSSAWVSVGVQVGDEVKVQVEEAHPRDDVLTFKEALAM